MLLRVIIQFWFSREECTLDRKNHIRNEPTIAGAPVCPMMRNPILAGIKLLCGSSLTVEIKNKITFRDKIIIYINYTLYQ